MQSLLFRLLGWLTVTADTVLQRLINFRAGSGVPLFADPPNRQLLAGKTAIVTGANTGLGLETARWLAAAGASVVLACRSVEKGALAAKAITDSVEGAIVEPAQLDLSDLGSVRAFAASFLTSANSAGGHDNPRKVHMLVLNAGVMCVPQNKPETHFAVNHVAHALLAFLLVPSLVAASNADSHARVVFVSSITFLLSNLDLDDISFSRRAYKSFIAYANSKLCNIMFMHALATRLAGTGVVCSAVHPGESTTDVARNLGSIWMTLHKKVGRAFLLSPKEASRTSVYAAAASEAAETTTVFYAVRRTLSVPKRLLAPEDVERLWEITLKDASVSEQETKAFCEACGLPSISDLQRATKED